MINIVLWPFKLIAMATVTFFTFLFWTAVVVAAIMVGGLALWFL